MIIHMALVQDYLTSHWADRYSHIWPDYVTFPALDAEAG
jgi:hypothetical protein